MLQFYFLSIAANLMGGLTLAGDAISRRMPGFATINAKLSGRRSKLTFGLASLVVGFCTLFVPVDPPVVLGDLLPSVVGMVMGIALLFEVFREIATLPTEQSERSERVPVGYRTTLGILGLVVAVLHFFLPDRIIL